MNDTATHEDNVLDYQSTNSSKEDKKKDTVPYYPTTLPTTKVVRYKKVGISIPIEDLPLWSEFQTIVIRKCGKLQGEQSKVLLRLIENYVLANKHHHAANYEQGLRSDVGDKIELIRQTWLNEQRLVFLEQEFRQSIQQITGTTDKRTVLKYVRLIFDRGCRRERQGTRYFINVTDFTGFTGLDRKYEQGKEGVQQ